MFEPCLNEGMTQVGSLSILTKHLLGLAKLYPEGNVEFGIVETILLMRMQSPPHKPTLLERVVILMVREQPQKVPRAVILAMDMLFAIVAMMEPISIDNLTSFLSFYLSNFDMAWPRFGHYAEELLEDGDEQSATKLFLSSFIDKCVRLVGVRKMRKVLPESIHYLVEDTISARLPIAGALDHTEEKDNSKVAESIKQFFSMLNDDGDVEGAKKLAQDEFGDEAAGILWQKFLKSMGNQIHRILRKFDNNSFSFILKDLASGATAQQVR
jgi:hypothetical protein